MASSLRTENIPVTMREPARSPALRAGPLGLIGRYIRVHLEDSPAYQEMRAEMPQEQKATSWSEPLRLLLRDHLHETLITFRVITEVARVEVSWENPSSS